MAPQTIFNTPKKQKSLDICLKGKCQSVFVRTFPGGPPFQDFGGNLISPHLSQGKITLFMDDHLNFVSEKPPIFVTSKPNERSCRIFLQKLLGFPLWPLFFCGKNCFFRIFWKMLWKCFEIFFNEFSSKKFRIFYNSLKLTIKFSKFFTAEFIEKKFENLLQSISLKKKFDIFSENSKKTFLPQKKGVTGGIPTIFPGKSDMTFCWVLSLRSQIKFCYLLFSDNIFMGNAVKAYYFHLQK